MLNLKAKKRMYNKNQEMPNDNKDRDKNKEEYKNRRYQKHNRHKK